MDAIWKFIVIIILAMYMLNLFGSSYYKETKAEGIKDRLVAGLIFISIFIVIYGLFVGIFYLFLSKINFSASIDSSNISNFDLSESTTLYSFAENIKRDYSTKADFLLCFLAPLTVLGSFCFAIFGGAGMALFPLELINNYIYKPVRPSAEEHVLAKKVLLEDSEGIIEKAKKAYDLRRDLDINPVTNPTEKKMKLKILNDKVNELKKELIEYEDVFTIFKLEDNIVESNPLVYLVSLILGILFAIISLLFIVHTILSIKGFYIILESMLLFLASLSSIFSLIIFLIINLYCGASIIKGSFKLSSMLSSILDTHPFKINGTWTDSFLLNNSILMLSFLGLIVYFVRFCPNYFRFLASELIFNKIITRLTVLKSIYEFKIFEYFFILFFFISVFISFFMKNGKAILMEKVKEKQMQIQIEKEKLQEMKKETKEAEKKP